jgi:hypothetical protein
MTKHEYAMFDETSILTPRVIISHICQANVPCRAGVEKITAGRNGIEDVCVAEARLGADEDVSKSQAESGSRSCGC